MAWKCASCGFVNGGADVARSYCQGCGVVLSARLCLTCKENGKQLSFAIDTTVGIHLLKRLETREAYYASLSQFKVTHDKKSGAWNIEPDPKALNQTWVDGTPASMSPVPLRQGSMISIGPDKLRLQVSFIVSH